MSLCICQTSLNCTLKSVHFVECYLYLNSKYSKNNKNSLPKEEIGLIEESLIKKTTFRDVGRVERINKGC